MSDPGKLFFDCYKVDPNTHRYWWGQLAGSLHRLVYVREEINAVSDISDIREAVPRLTYHVENYLARVSELRERASKLLIAYSKKKGATLEDTLSDLQGYKTRENTLKDLLPHDPDLRDGYLTLLHYLHGDIGLRNKNTHEVFLSAIYGDDDVFDYLDEDNPTDELRAAMEQTVVLYDEKINHILRLTEKILNHCQP